LDRFIGSRQVTDSLLSKAAPFCGRQGSWVWDRGKRAVAVFNEWHGTSKQARTP
jgi:hypothetical protein